jgi:hypothetical protein
MNQALIDEESSLDLELYIATEILGLESPHYGYWAEPLYVTSNNLNLESLHWAQISYTNTLIELIPESMPSTKAQRLLRPGGFLLISGMFGINNSMEHNRNYEYNGSDVESDYVDLALCHGLRLRKELTLARSCCRVSFMPNRCIISCSLMPRMQ